MCIFRIRKIYYDNKRLQSSLKYKTEECERLDYECKRLRAEMEQYKKQKNILEKYKIQINELKSAIKMFVMGEVNEDDFAYYARDGFSLDALINSKKKQCDKNKEIELENLQFKPIELDDESR